MLDGCGFEAVNPEIPPSALNVSDLVIYNVFITSDNHTHICNISLILFFFFFFCLWLSSVARNI